MTPAVIWIKGARPRTLTLSVVPVVVGTAAAGTATIPRTLGCLAVGLGMQVGVNYANDYFDGVRGVDTAARVGPVRLVAGGLASARAVLVASLLSFAVAGLVGLALARAVDGRILWAGGAAILAALGYSGGPRPYASAGLGELSVFAFFGLVAVCGTAFVQAGEIRDDAWWAAVPIGLLAVAVLVANNVRDIATDAASGKRTLAVRLGDRPSRALYRIVVVVALATPVAGVATGALPLAALLVAGILPLALNPLRLAGSATGPDLVRVLVGTVLLQLEFGAVLALGLWLG